MKDKFIGYRKKSSSEIKKIWNDGFITFDANVLLNLYRYSETTRKEILRLIEKFNKKIFLTHQSCLEFHRNRFEVISEQENIYKDFIVSIIKIEDDLNSKSKHPFLSDKLQNKLNKVLNEVKKETKGNEKYYCDLILGDEIYNEIDKLFKGKVEEDYTPDELNSIIEEGKKRFNEKIPPGFEDEKDKSGIRAYGDLILWKQIIDNAKRNNKPIILVTDEKKKDWWWKLKNGKTIGPRQELVEEIKKEANVAFHLYSTEKFIEYGLDYLNEKSNPKVVEEIKELRVSKSSRFDNFIDYNISEDFWSSKLNKGISPGREYQIIEINGQDLIHKSRDFNEKYQLSREEESKLLNSRLDTLDRRKRKLIREKTLLDNRAKLTIDERERLLNILRLIQDIDNEVNSIYNGDDNSDS
jgi:hypothetical protein